ncbi:multidrug resistance efflux transporter family protein [Gallaecimonas sp. GXIMD4217]|uniref:multidrug resistance efflux transporter family protein n=1 Tax=Gallaecimonas sp. GXIMD4217 TaxID=3131927 RepID=UPI00311B0A63
MSTASLLVLGLLSALFFSATFLVNRALALEGGHWFWSAALRYGYMIALLAGGLALVKGRDYLAAVLAEFRRHCGFWCLAGSIGFGCFYALICFAAVLAPGWVVATSWQLTIIASLLVLRAFGQPLSAGIWLCTLVVVAGVTLVNLAQLGPSASGWWALLPVLLAAFCYPLGNQLVWARKRRLAEPGVLDNAFAKVLLLSLGSLPFWLLLFAALDTGRPSAGQLGQVALVALLSGVVATTLFLYARGRADSPARLAVVDATQSGEVLFALGGEVLLLGAALPGQAAVAGIGLTLVGLLALAWLSRG